MNGTWILNMSNCAAAHAYLPGRIIFLTAEGSSTLIATKSTRTLPHSTFAMVARSWQLVRIRGCYIAERDMQTRQVIGGSFVWGRVMDVGGWGRWIIFLPPPSPGRCGLMRVQRAARTKVVGQILYAEWMNVCNDGGGLSRSNPRNSSFQAVMLSRLWVSKMGALRRAAGSSRKIGHSAC